MVNRQLTRDRGWVYEYGTKNGRRPSRPSAGKDDDFAKAFLDGSAGGSEEKEAENKTAIRVGNFLDWLAYNATVQKSI